MRPIPAVPAPAPSISDEALAGELIGGDMSAFDQLVRRWRDRVVDLASLLLHDRDLAEDVGQEVFLRLHRKPHAYDPTRPFSAWILTVTRNLCFDNRRRLRARAKYQKKAVEERKYGPRPTEAPPDGALHSEAQELLRRAIADLPAQFRDAYVLCGVRGLSYEEAAGICGCGVKTVSTRLARARRRLVERMKGWL